LQVLQILRSAQAVCFDVDSTVCTDEGIDELAAFLGAGEAVAEWTRKAMGGGVPFQDALKARLDLMNPSRHQVGTQQQHGPAVCRFVRDA
jgi:phosphoserine phosphatase